MMYSNLCLNSRETGPLTPPFLFIRPLFWYPYPLPYPIGIIPILCPTLYYPYPLPYPILILAPSFSLWSGPPPVKKVLTGPNLGTFCR